VRVACSYCRRTIRDDPRARITDISHGMCEECGRHFERLWAGMPVDEYLDDLSSPVLLVDAEARIIAMNAKAADLVGADRETVRGLTDCEAFACVHSRLPGGCGRTAHCRECAVRRAVETVARTGKPKERVQAYVDVEAGRIDLRISATPAEAGAVRVKIEEMGEPRPRTGKRGA
jgi:PAS domain-containing protein